MVENVAALGILADFIDYPTYAMIGTLDEAWTLLESDRHLPREELQRLAHFVTALRGAELSILQEDYVSIFRRGRGVSLYLGDHPPPAASGHADPAADLRELYEKQGLYLNRGEMPDYLPVFLDFLARQPWKRARHLLAERAATLTEIAFHLSDSGSGYSIPVAALVALAGAPPLRLAQESFGGIVPPTAMPVDVSSPQRHAGRAPDFSAIVPDWSALYRPAHRVLRRRH